LAPFETTETELLPHLVVWDLPTLTATCGITSCLASRRLELLLRMHDAWMQGHTDCMWLEIARNVSIFDPATGTP